MLWRIFGWLLSVTLALGALTFFVWLFLQVAY